MYILVEGVEAYCAVVILMEGGDCVVHHWGQLIFYMRLKSPLLLTRPKALVSSTKAMYSGCYCPLQFSCSLRSVKITSTVDLPALKLQASQLMSRAKILPTMLRGEIPE